MSTATDKRREQRACETPAQAFARREREAEARLAAQAAPQHIAAMVATALAAPSPDVASLATRHHVAAAIKTLTQLCEWRGAPGLGTPAAILWPCGDPDVILSHRIALGLELFLVGKADHVRHDREWLRSLDSEPARVALALLGECTWATASPRVRAGHLLGLIVALRRAVST